MDSRAVDILNDVSPRKGRRSFKLFFGTLVGFAIALYCIPTDPVREKPRTVKKGSTKQRTTIPIWSWKTLLTGVEEKLSPLVANTSFQGDAEKKPTRTDARMDEIPNGSIRSTQGGGVAGAKEALSRIAKSETEQFTKNALQKAKNRNPASVTDAARVPGAVALLGATLASGRQMKVRVDSDTLVRAQVARDETLGRDYRLNVERKIPGLGTSLSSGVSSNGGLDQVSVRQSLGDGWNLGVDRSRIDRGTVGSTSDRRENAVTLGFSSDF